MNEEEREIVKKFERLYLKDFNNEKITNEDRLSYIECVLMSNLIEKLQKENEELRKKLNEENKRCMMLAIEKQDYFEKYRYHLQQNESLTKEFSNVISVQKVKDKIEYLDNQQKQWLEDRELKESDREIIFANDILQELIEEREEK